MFAVRCPGLLLQILRFAQNDNGRVLRMTSLVTIDAATGGVDAIESVYKKRVSKSVDFKTRLLSSTGISPAVPYLITARPVPGHPGHSEAPAEVPADQPAARPERPWPYPRKRHARRC